MIADPAFRYADAWLPGEGWVRKGTSYQKAPGVSSGLSCFSPVVEGEDYWVEVELADVRAGGVHPAAGAGGLGAFFGTDGKHGAVIRAGGDNALFGLLASANFEGQVRRFDARPAVAGDA
jgi:hypothetical protein